MRSTATRIASIETPADVGSPGPGEIDDAAQLAGRVVGQGLDPGPVDRVVAHDVDLGPARLERLDEVERERVVVVDDQDHRDSPSRRPRPAGWQAPGWPGRRLSSGQVDCPAQRRGLVLGLLELALRDGARDDPRAGVDVGQAVAQDGASDRDRRVEVAVVAEVADRTRRTGPAARSRPPRSAASPGPSGRRTGCRPGRRERSASRASQLGLQAALDVADQVEDVAVALDLHVLGDPHRARPGHPAEVVAAQVDQHHVLGLLLRVALELLG